MCHQCCGREVASNRKRKKEWECPCDIARRHSSTANTHAERKHRMYEETRKEKKIETYVNRWLFCLSQVTRGHGKVCNVKARWWANDGSNNEKIHFPNTWNIPLRFQMGNFTLTYILLRQFSHRCHRRHRLFAVAFFFFSSGTTFSCRTFFIHSFSDYLRNE